MKRLSFRGKNPLDISMSFEKLLAEYIKSRPRISVDSRKVLPGDWFFALPGQKTDGHMHVEEAKQKGASLIIVQKGEGFKVENTLLTLQELAREIQASRKAKIIAVTGSVGKTTTRELLTAILSTQFKVGKNLNNHNSQIGLPLTLLNDVDGTEDFLVLEMAMTHPGQIKRLTEIAPPYISVITKIAPVHIVNFESIHGIAQAKAEILSHPQTRYGILNIEYSDWPEFRKSQCEIITFGKNYKYPVPELPSHHHENYYAACTVFELLGGNLSKLPTRFSGFEKRFQTVIKSGITFVNDSYNAAEVSIVGALKNLPKGSRKIALLGEMRELGKHSEEAHIRVGESALNYVDQVILVGEGCLPIQRLWEEKRVKPKLCKDYKEALIELKKEAKSGDVVLIKGANGLGLWRVFEEF